MDIDPESDLIHKFLLLLLVADVDVIERLLWTTNPKADILEHYVLNQMQGMRAAYAAFDSFLYFVILYQKDPGRFNTASQCQRQE